MNITRKFEDYVDEWSAPHSITKYSRISEFLKTRIWEFLIPVPPDIEVLYQNRHGRKESEANLCSRLRHSEIGWPMSFFPVFVSSNWHWFKLKLGLPRHEEESNTIP